MQTLVSRDQNQHLSLRSRLSILWKHMLAYTTRTINLRWVKRSIKSNTILSVVSTNSTTLVSLSDKFLSAGIDEEADQVRSHVVTTEVTESFWKVRLVEIDLENC